MEAFLDLIRMVRVAYRGIEIQHAVDFPSAADPFVDLQAHGLALLRATQTFTQCLDKTAAEMRDSRAG
jgi:hypothetical protein